MWGGRSDARSLQGLDNGAVAQSGFRAAVEAELRAPHRLTNGTGTPMLATYTQLLSAWEQVAEGAALELRWPG
ncbi:MAG: hypothetical protein IPG10_19020 [Flavobacteriales bacterium]|nr:hypothetical protein [Flavobacteriales bacterium]